MEQAAPQVLQPGHLAGLDKGLYSNVRGASNLLFCVGGAAEQPLHLGRLYGWGFESGRTAHRAPWADRIAGLALLMGRAAV